MKSSFICLIFIWLIMGACHPDPKRDCWHNTPTIKLINFDTLDLQSICIYEYKRCCSFDSLITKDSVGQYIHLQNGAIDTFEISRPINFSGTGQYIKLGFNNYKIVLRNGVEVRISNFIQSNHQCTVPYGHQDVFCPCDLLGFDITSVNCVTQKIDNTTALVVK